jgi:RNA ligase (TIGR02306 family)
MQETLMTDDQAFIKAREIGKERAMATIEIIAEIKPIPDADAIEALRVKGWWVVAKKGEFAVGDTAVFVEIDAWVPHAIAPFLSSGLKTPRVYQDIPGARLRTVKLRGQVSQGLLLPLSVLGDALPAGFYLPAVYVSAALGIVKWERPIPSQLRGLIRGSFPSEIRKTDQERIQNIAWHTLDPDTEYEITTKLDGSSMTVYVDMSGELGVCSRNLDLSLDQANADNTFVRLAREEGLLDILLDYFERTGLSIALQGELMGPGIQGNREGLEKHAFYLYNIWDINKQTYYEPQRCRDFARAHWIDHVPVLHERTRLPAIGVTYLSDILEYASRQSSLSHKIAEGVVFKACQGDFSFKAISNRFLLKEKG